MNTVTRIFHFEMAHAIHGYKGPCSNIHGHSYELHVTVAGTTGLHQPTGTGFIIDFRDLKSMVNDNIIQHFDHALALSENYLEEYPCLISQPNLIRLQFEPSAENLISDIAHRLKKELTKELTLYHLRLYETKNSYAEWYREVKIH